MIEIIRAVRSIIPATELTFLSLHTYLYSKIQPCLRLRSTPVLSSNKKISTEQSETTTQEDPFHE